MINIVLLCYEITKGMKSFGPKAMIPVGNKNHSEPLIVKQIKTLQKLYDNTSYQIHVVVGFEQDRVIKALKSFGNKINIIKYSQYAEANSAGAVLECLHSIKNGDYLFIENGIVCSYKPIINTKSITPILKKQNKNDKFAIGVTVSDNKAEYLFYDLANKWSELLFITEADAQLIRNISDHKQCSHMFLFEYINLLIEASVVFYVDSIANNQIVKILNHKVVNHVNLST